MVAPARQHQCSQACGSNIGACIHQKIPNMHLSVGILLQGCAPDVTPPPQMELALSHQKNTAGTKPPKNTPCLMTGVALSPCYSTYLMTWDSTGYMLPTLYNDVGSTGSLLPPTYLMTYSSTVPLLPTLSNNLGNH